MADPRVRIVYEFQTKMQHCEVKCGACRRAVIYPPVMANELFGGLTALDRLEKRLRCTHCGAKAARVQGIYREYHG